MRRPSTLLVLVLVLAGCERELETDLESSSIPQDSRPNVLLIVADDLGFSDLGSYGSEIETPHLDALAERGVRLTNFHASITCAPTRAMLLTGLDNHVAGLGAMAEFSGDNQVGVPGYEGYLSPAVPTIVEELRGVGYHTYMVGKWHLGTSYEASAHKRGFEQTFGPIYGGGSHFADRIGPEASRRDLLYRENGQLLRELPQDFYSTRSYTDRAITQIESNLQDGRPFFSYVAYTAPHWPLQAPGDTLDRYRGRYDAGYDQVRARRLERMSEQKLFEADPRSFEVPEYLRPWDSLSAGEAKTVARDMEIYAAMVHELDLGVGRLLSFLEDVGELTNTLVIFLSDNGAEAWSDSFGPEFWTPGKFSREFDNALERRGHQGSFVFYGPQWAHVSNAPFSWYKGITGEGGGRVPSIAFWPGQIKAGVTSDALTFVADWFWTIAAATGLSPEQSRPPLARDLLPLLDGRMDSVRGPEDFVGIEMWGRRALYQDDWKIRLVPQPLGTGSWELFNLRRDPFEQQNLAAEYPDVMKAMTRSWEMYVAQNNVIVPKMPLVERAPVIPER